MAGEAAASRGWAGIHYVIDDDIGLTIGHQVGYLVAEFARTDGAEGADVASRADAAGAAVRRPAPVPLPDEQTGYVWHVYPGHYPEEWADTLDDLDKEKPVVVTEWGFEPDAKQHWSGDCRGVRRAVRRISWMRAGCHRPLGAGTPTMARACASPAAS